MAVEAAIRAEKSSEHEKSRPFGRLFLIGAGDEARTRYLHLGKVALYRMSYTRDCRSYYTRCFPFCQVFFSKNARQPKSCAANEIFPTPAAFPRHCIPPLRRRARHTRFVFLSCISKCLLFDRRHNIFSYFLQKRYCHYRKNNVKLDCGTNCSLCRERH